MKALLSRTPGGPETLTLEEVADPVPGPGELLVAVKACSINFPDVLVIEDKYQFKPRRPFAPGGEVAGIVEAVGEGVTDWKAGDRIFALCSSGGLAEKVVFNPDRAFLLPESRSFIEGAALLLTFGTNYHGLVDRGAMKAGDNVLILGAAGGVGLAAVELAKALGARVVAAVSSDEKAAMAKSAGADETLVYPGGPLDRDQSKALADAFKAAAGKDGFDIVYDPVGGDYAEPALRSLGWEGRYLVVGFPAGIPKMPLNLTLLKSCDIRGVFWGVWAARNPAHNRRNVEALVRLWEEGKIAPRVTETFPLERGGEAIAKLGDRKALGKLVVLID